MTADTTTAAQQIINNNLPTASIGKSNGVTTSVPKNVDMTNVGSTSEVTTPEAEPVAEVKHFDTNDLTSLPTKYIQTNKFYFNMPIPAFIQSNNDPYTETCFGGSLKNQNELTNNFKKGILRNQQDRKSFYEAIERFANLDQVNYKYSHHPILGDIRIRIDENGKEIGLPEGIDINGSPINFTTPSNLHDYNTAPV